MSVMEFWPEYGAGPLWDERGTSVDVASLGLPHDLVARVSSWNARYSEDKLPIDGGGDEAWLAEGLSLLGELRASLSGSSRIIVTEAWWGAVG